MKVNVAILDLYNRVPNEGMRCIQSILTSYGLEKNLDLQYRIFDVRYANELPGTDYDVYISTGGPGSPFDGEGMAWESGYFRLIDQLWNDNQRLTERKKHVFFICHSFQMMCRLFQLGEVTKRRSTAFGIFPIHQTKQGRGEGIFKGLPEPFHAVDSRDWQVVQPKRSQLEALNATVLAIEKERPHVELERAVMAIRLSDEFMGTQFHPEADAQGMTVHFSKPEKQQQIIENYGEAKYQDMLQHLRDPDKIALTQRIILPSFLDAAVEEQWENAL